MLTYINNIILTNEELKNLDSQAASKDRIPPIVLMEEASGKILDALKSDFNLGDERISVLAGPGNNGGDALSAARKLLFEGYDVDVYLLSGKTGSELYEIQKNILISLKVKLLDLSGFPDYSGSYSLIIDGIFGIGYKYRKDPMFEKIFSSVNSGHSKVVSIDTPSGLNAGNNASVRADYTYSIGYLKEYFFNIDNRKNAGLLTDLKISFGLSGIDIKNKPIYINKIEPLTKKTNPFVHKYSRGGCISIGGQPGKYGSIVFTARSALNAGTGISLVITENDNVIPVNSMSSEIIADSIENINNYISKYGTIIVGPGLKFNSQTGKDMVQSIFSLDKKFVLDASFFTIFEKSVLKSFSNPPVLTPQSQEFKNFFREEAENLKNDTINCVSAMAVKYNCFIILKESFLVIATPTGEKFIYDNPMRILAQAGSGDILAGITGGILCQGYECLDAIMESIRIFYGIAENFRDSRSYSHEKFIKMIADE